MTIVSRNPSMFNWQSFRRVLMRWKNEAAYLLELSLMHTILLPVVAPQSIFSCLSPPNIIPPDTGCFSCIRGLFLLDLFPFAREDICLPFTSPKNYSIDNQTDGRHVRYLYIQNGSLCFLIPTKSSNSNKQFPSIKS